MQKSMWCQHMSNKLLYDSDRKGKLCFIELFFDTLWSILNPIIFVWHLGAETKQTHLEQGEVCLYSEGLLTV